MPATASGERCKTHPDAEVMSVQPAGATEAPAVVVLSLLAGLAILSRLAFLVPVCIACFDRSGEHGGGVGSGQG